MDLKLVEKKLAEFVDGLRDNSPETVKAALLAMLAAAFDGYMAGDNAIKPALKKAAEELASACMMHLGQETPMGGALSRLIDTLENREDPWFESLGTLEWMALQSGVNMLRNLEGQRRTAR